MTNPSGKTFFVRSVLTSGEHDLDASTDLLLTFDPSLPTGGAQIESVQRVLLSPSWQGLRAEFGPYSLKQLFVQRLLDLKPARVVIDGLNTASAELLRCAHALGLQVKCTAALDPTEADLRDVHDHRWLEHLPGLQSTFTPADQSTPIVWDYGLYSMGLRDQALLQKLNQPALDQLAGCHRVLDLGCGTGVLIDQLMRRGVTATGVERDTACVRYAQSLGLQVVQADALQFLGSISEKFEGIACSHFVEHLDIETVKELIRGIARGLTDEGVAVLVFPDPESIRSQLLGFWRDPEHVRFYHPELIIALARVEGLVCEFNSTAEPDRAVGSFSARPPAFPTQEAASRGSLVARFTQWVGLASRAELHFLQRQTEHQARLIEHLWRVNQIWAWEDNAVIRLRKVRT